MEDTASVGDLFPHARVYVIPRRWKPDSPGSHGEGANGITLFLRHFEEPRGLGFCLSGVRGGVPNLVPTLTTTAHRWRLSSAGYSQAMSVLSVMDNLLSALFMLRRVRAVVEGWTFLDFL